MTDVSHITKKNYSVSGSSDLLLLLYHETDVEGVAGIHDIQMMKSGSGGMLGAGIYFAESQEDARKKSQHKGIMIVVLVRVGWMLVLSREANHGLNADVLRETGCDSIKSVGHITGPEYVVYDPDQVIAAWVISGIPNVPQVIFPGPEWDTRPLCEHDDYCKQRNPQHFREVKHLSPPIFQMRVVRPVQRDLCRAGSGCTDTSYEHFMEFSHPSCVLLPPLPHSTPTLPYRTKPGCIFSGRESGHKKRRESYYRGINGPKEGSHAFDGSRGRSKAAPHEPRIPEYDPSEDGKKPCIYGVDCPFLDDIDHFFEFSHPPGVTFKVPCKFGLRCTNRSEEHLSEFSHGPALRKMK